MTTSGLDFYHDDLEPEHIAALLDARGLTPNEIVEGLWHGQALVRRNAARGARFVTAMPDPGEAMLRIASKDPDEGVRGAVVAACAAGLGALSVALPILFDALMDKGDGIRDTALQGLEQRFLKEKAAALPFFIGALADLRGSVSAVASQLLIQAGGAESIPALVPLLGHGDSRLRRAAYDILDRMKYAAIDALIAALADPGPRPLAGKLLSGLGEVSADQKAALEVYLGDGDPTLVALVDKVLADLGRVVEAPRTTPLDLPVPGFLERFLDPAELGEVGGLALDELMYALRDGRAPVRHNAALALGRHEGVTADGATLAKVVGKLAPTTRDGDERVRVAAVSTLGLLVHEDAVRALVKALGDLAPEVRQAAALALVAHGPEALVTALHALEIGARPTVAAGLREVAAQLAASPGDEGQPVVEVLADALSAADLPALGREVAAAMLGDLGQRAEAGVPALLALLRDPMEDVRAAAAAALGHAGIDDPIIIEALRRMLLDTVPNVRRQAALAAARITGRPLDDRGAADPQPVPIDGFETEALDVSRLADHGVPLELLARALRDGRSIVKANAALALATLGEAAAPAAQPLGLLLRDAEAPVRAAAITALRSLGKGALPAAWFLTAALAEPEAELRDQVIDLLVGLFPEAADHLVEALRTDTDNARGGIFNVWYRLARGGVPTLGQALRNPSGLIRLNACWALELLAKRGADEVLDDLEARLADPIGQVRGAAQVAIDAIKGGKPRPPRVLEPDPVAIAGFDERVLPADTLEAERAQTTPERMLRALRDGRAYVRENAIGVLAAMVAHGEAEAADVVSALAVVARDGLPAVRAAALRALSRVSSHEAAALLVAGLEDRAEPVREVARLGLASLGVTALPALVEGLVRLAPLASLPPEEQLRRSVLALLAKLAEPAPDEVCSSLVAALDDESPLIRAGALFALRVIGRDRAEPAREAVLAREADPDAEVARQARATHDHLDGKDVAPAAADALPLPAPMVERTLGLTDLRELFEAHGPLEVGLVLKACQDGRELVRANAARAVALLEDPPKRAAMSLALLLRDGDPEVRKAAAEALELRGAAFAAPVAFWLVVALQDPDPEIRDRVVTVLAAVHGEWPEALIEGLRVDPDLAHETILLVVDRVGSACVPTLARGLANASGLIRINAAQGLELLAKRGAQEVLDQLEAKLADPINQVRQAAAAAIDAIKGGKPRPPRVLEPDPVAIAGFDERVLAVELLEAERHQTTPERMLRALRDGRAFVRENAITLLGAMVSHEEAEAAAVVQALAVVGRDGLAQVRRATLRALGRIGNREAAALLVHGLEDKVEDVREVARAGLRGLGTRALPALVEGLLRLPALAALPQEEQRRRSVLPLFSGLAQGHPDEVVSALRAAMDSDSALLQIGGLRALRVIGRDLAERARADVTRLAAHPDEQVAREAKATVDHLDGKDVAPAAAPALPLPGPMIERVLTLDELREVASGLEVALVLKASQDGREVVRSNAARTVALLEDPPKRAAMALALLLRDGDVEVRKAAAEALELRGATFAAPVAFWLTVALQDPDAETRERVVNVLAGVHAEAPEAIIEGLRVDPDLAHETILVVIDRIGAGAVPTMMTALGNPSGLIRINAAQALEVLAKRGAGEALDLLETKLSDPIGRVRLASQNAIDAIKGGRPRPPKVIEPDPIEVPDFTVRLLDDEVLGQHASRVAPERLLRALRDGRPFVRGNAATLLGWDESLPGAAPTALGALAVLAKDSAIDVRRRAVTALGRFAARASEAARDTTCAVLTQAIQDSAQGVRKAAEDALRQLGEAAFPALTLALASPTPRVMPHLVPLFQALGDQARDALPDALGPLTPELHLGALLALRGFEREGLEPHRPLVDALTESSDPAVKAAARALLDRIDKKDLAPAALEPTPLPLPGFADHLLSREVLAAHAGELRFDLLTHAARDGRELVRANAMTGLEVLGSAQQAAFPYLARGMKDPSPEVRLRAAEALAALPPRRDLAFDLVLALDDASPRVVAAAERALRAYREFAIDAFMYALDDAPEIVGKTILPMLAGLGAQALDALVLAQRYDSPLVRRNALTAMRMMERDTVSAVRPTVSLARKDEDREVRLEALRTLDWVDGVVHSMLREPRPLPLATFATEAVPEDTLVEVTRDFDAQILTELLFDGRRGVRENAATAFGLLGRFHPWLPILLKDDTVAVQRAAARALLRLGDLVLPAAPSLIEALSEDDEEVRELARQTLEQLGDKALPALVRATWAPADQVRRTILPIIEKLENRATPAIIEALDHPSQLVVLNALIILGRLYGVDPEGAVKGMDKVKALIRHPLPAIIGAAQKCLFRLEGRTPAEFQKDPVPMPILGFDKGPLPADVLRPNAPILETGWLISAMADGRPVVRENAARAVGYLPGQLKDLLPSLLIALKDSVPEVQVAAADAFATLQTEDAEAIPALTFALRNATERVKRACMVALDAYGPKRVATELCKHLVGREDWMLVTIGKVAARMSEVLVPALADFAQDTSKSLVARENAVRIIGDLGARARGVEGKLLALLSEMEGMLAPKAAFSIGRIARPTKELIEAMQKRLEVDPRPGLHKEVRDAVKVLKRRQGTGT